MRPGQAAPVFQLGLVGGGGNPIASMRPGQAAPVFRSANARIACFAYRFNEAGAGCPGIPERDTAVFRRRAALQ